MHVISEKMENRMATFERNMFLISVHVECVVLMSKVEEQDIEKV